MINPIGDRKDLVDKHYQIVYQLQYLMPTMKAERNRMDNFSQQL